MPRENSSETVKIYFSGATIDPATGGAKAPQSDAVLFTVKFSVKADAPFNTFGIDLNKTELFNTAAGLRQVDESYYRLACAVGCNRVETFIKIVLPAAAPTILSGLKLGLSYTIIGVVVGELLVVNAGMGYLIDWAAFQYLTPELYALIIITMCLGVCGYAGFTQMERLITK